MQLIDLPPAADGTALVIHGGAGDRPHAPSAEADALRGEGLARAYAAGRAVLDAGGSALDAVCAAVVELENCPVFNAGVGAALTDLGGAELDAAVMTGGRAGGVAASRVARNPVLAARAVMERTPHALIASPDAEQVGAWGLETVGPEHFVTPEAQAHLAEVLAGRAEPEVHGTVGAVARDKAGRLAAATSTGGISGQRAGRIGDTPIVGAGTYAADGVVAVSCTGLGEAFLRGVVGHEIGARVRLAEASLPDAVGATMREEISAKDAFGAIIAVGGDGRAVVCWDAATLSVGYSAGGVPVLRN